MYIVYEVDRAGSPYSVYESEEFAPACVFYHARKELKGHKDFAHFMINSEQVDVDCNGLTEEEEERLEDPLYGLLSALLQ